MISKIMDNKLKTRKGFTLMKVSKKLLTFGLAIAILMVSSIPVFALPGNTVVIGNKAFSLDYFFDTPLNGEITKAITDGGDIYLDVTNTGNNFKDAFNGNAITDQQKAGINNIEYLNYDGSRDTYATFDSDKTVIDVKDIRLVENNTKVEVTFTDNVKKVLDNVLVPGSNTITFEYKGKSFTKTVVVPNPTPTRLGVEKIEMVNYRYIKVTFNGLVDKDSAQDPTNYYFEMVDGNAAYGALPTLLESNQLSKIETDYSGNWWLGDSTKPRHIKAEDINGKTIVSIYLPEDARFTNVVDGFIGSYPYPYNAADDERTLAVKMKDSKTDGYTLKALIKDTSVNVAVRNVMDTNKNFTIDTASMPIRILDEVSPELVDVQIVDAPDSNYAAAPTSFDLVRTNPALNQEGQALKFIYSEPVFDAHRSDMSDLDWYRDITLYVNGKSVASLSRGNLLNYMHFDMDLNSTYDSSRAVIIDVEKAIKDTYSEQFATNIDYTIKFVGITDLAGNIEVPSDHTFTVRFHDNPATNPQIVMPQVLGVEQVADNIFRVEFNRAGVEGTFVIQNPDGEGETNFYDTHIVPSIKSDNGKFYSYVAVPACDNEDAAAIAIPTGIEKNDILAYDSNKNIMRTIRVQDIVVRAQNDPVSDVDLRNNTPFIKNMVLADDVNAPVAMAPADVIPYGSRGSILNIKVKDTVPANWADDENITPYWVSPIKYVYDPITESFGNEIMADQKNAPDTYLPVKVYYYDAAGAKHEVMVSNYNLDPDRGGQADKNPGYLGSISWDAANNTLKLDLSAYAADMLDSDHQLVAGATYYVEIPKGYFTDSPLDLDFSRFEDEFEYGPYDYDILYVDDARDGDDYHWVRPRHRPSYKEFTDAGLGYTSSESLPLAVRVGVGTTPPPPAQHVPQTSKELINYDEATNSMKIEFTGNIDLNTLRDKNNYSFNGKTLAQWDAELGTNTVVDYEVSNVDGFHQYAKFIIPQDSIQVYGNYAFTVQGVAHPDGAKMVPVTTEVRLEDVYRPVVINAVQTGLKQIKLTFNEPIKYFVDTEVVDALAVANNFIVRVNGNALTVATAVLPTGPDTDREITLNLGSEIPLAGNITVEIVKDGNGNILVIDKSGNKNPMKMATYDVTRLVSLP